MQQAIGKIRVVFVAQTLLAVVCWDAYVSTDTRLQLWAQRLHSGLRERVRGRESEDQSVLTV